MTLPSQVISHDIENITIIKAYKDNNVLNHTGSKPTLLINETPNMEKMNEPTDNIVATTEPDIAPISSVNSSRTESKVFSSISSSGIIMLSTKPKTKKNMIPVNK